MTRVFLRPNERLARKMLGTNAYHHSLASNASEWPSGAMRQAFGELGQMGALVPTFEPRERPEDLEAEILTGDALLVRLRWDDTPRQWISRT